MGSHGGFNVPNFPINPPHRTEHFFPPDFGGINPGLFVALIVILVIAALTLGIVFMYIGSVMRFILFDSVLAKECHIREGWRRRLEPGWRYFLWQLAYMLVTFGVFVIVVGIPAGLAFAAGWFSEPSQHMVGLVLAGIALFFVFVILFIAMMLVYVLTKDFVVPQMALEGIGAVEGWRRLWPMMKAEKGGYAGYVGMKILLTIGVGIILGIVSFILALVILIPVVGIVIAAVYAGQGAGLGWNAGTITLAVVAGCVLVAFLLFAMALISVPAIVFFPAYSIYFFAARYPRLSAVLYPAPPSPQVSPSSSPPPLELPPLPPTPEPIG